MLWINNILRINEIGSNLTVKNIVGQLRFNEHLKLRSGTKYPIMFRNKTPAWVSWS